MPITPDNLPDDPDALKRIIATMAQDALTAQAEIARLKFQLARYRRTEFGRSSEKLARDTDAGGRRAAAIYSLIESAKLNGLNPQYYIADVLARIADHPARRIDELLPWNWRPLDATRAAA